MGGEGGGREGFGEGRAARAGTAGKHLARPIRPTLPTHQVPTHSHVSHSLRSRYSWANIECVLLHPACSRLAAYLMSEAKAASALGSAE